MKRTYKIMIKKGGDIKAIIDTDGKILTSSPPLKKTLMDLMAQDMISQESKGGVSSTTLTKITNEAQLYAHLSNELIDEGYDVE